MADRFQTGVCDHPGRLDEGRCPTYPGAAIQEIEIDEGLTLEITNGLGSRKVESQPNIFLLSGDSGVVVIDLCVNSSGKVTMAEFNTDKSTIFRSSLTSLALRKAREFVFMASLNPEQCGSMVYRFEGE